MKIKPRSNKNTKGEQLYRCPFPNCGAIFAKEPWKPETCLKHRALIADVMFILDHLKKPETADAVGPQDGPKIFVPKPGMADKAIEEARRAGRGPH